MTVLVQPRILAFVASLAVAVIWPLVTGDYFTSVGLNILMWIALSESWIVLSGMTGYLSLGHAVFYGLGAYVMATTWGAVPIWAGVLAGGGAAGLLAAVVGYPCLRVRGPYFVMLTFGLAEFVKFTVIDIEAALSKFGRIIIGTPSLSALYYAMLVLAVAAFLMVWQVRRGRFGAGLRAIREDEEAAQATGIPVTRYKLTAFVLSGIIPGMVGGLMLLRASYFEPQTFFSPLMSLTIICIAVIGGSDAAAGPLFGTFFLVVLSELLWAQFPHLYLIIVGAILIIFVLAAPDGLSGRLQAWKRRATPKGPRYGTPAREEG